MKQMVLKMTMGLGLMALAASQASAQGSNCGPRQAVIDRLAETYGESRQSMGLGASGQVVEVFASDASGTWTITVTLPNGLMCLMASGQAYEALAEALIKPENDA
ncbi:hypothetical protein [Aestuariivita sp.]|jgi:hypothetical protein|uniref:hypothetical protein n=1 Tax=Aestuariivita sp. TaxID=1872407 RepID=UPI002172D862|nr:hypothetical protein [Aestuariivita sp.]MCE8007606.1 hypothetical protein [Aestuariivita sp.]